MSMSPAVDVTSLRKTYRDGLFGRRRVEALAGVTLDVGRGEIFGLLGPNGAGKTTLIKVLLGMVRATGGAASLLGRSAGSRAARREVGYLPENHRIPRHHTGNSALLYFGSLSGLSRAEVRAPQRAVVGHRGPGRPGGKRRSKNTPRACCSGWAWLRPCCTIPQLLILDEPTDGVDPVGRSEMRTLLLGTQGGRQNDLHQQPPAAGSRAGMRPGGDPRPRADVAARDDLRADGARRAPKCDWSSPAASTSCARRWLECPRPKRARSGTEQFEIVLATSRTSRRSTARSTGCAGRA